MCNIHIFDCFTRVQCTEILFVVAISSRFFYMNKCCSCTLRLHVAILIPSLASQLYISRCFLPRAHANYGETYIARTHPLP